jgi:hypothetical protein
MAIGEAQYYQVEFFTVASLMLISQRQRELSSEMIYINQTVILNDQFKANQ